MARKKQLNLARRKNERKQLIATIQRTTEALTRSDIGDWRRAWQLAISVDSPNRQWLYDIYRDAEVDNHLAGCIEQRRGFVMAKSFKLTDTDGNEDEEAEHMLMQPWFRLLCRYILDSIYWGHSLIELGDIVTDGDGCLSYDTVRLLPRKYVIPEYHRIITDLGMDWHTGIDYHLPEWSSSLIEAGQPHDLGLLLKAATQTIPKKNMLAFWDTFGEIFGMPMRIGHTTLRDDKETRRMERMMQEMGHNFWGVFPEGTDIQIVESSKGDAFNVYDKRIDRANSEISKLIIGQTMTIEDGSSLSQSQTHLQVFQNLIEADAAMLAEVINNQLLPRMVQSGFPMEGLRFEWNDTIDYTPEQQVAYETMIADRYNVDPEYFATKYGMSVGDRREAALSLAKKNEKPFFD